MDRFTYDSPEYKTYMQEHVHERGEICFLESVARAGMTAVDVGGHFGLAACAISRAIGGTYRGILGGNLARNALQNVEVVPAALGKQAGRTLLYKDNDGTSIVPKPDRESVEADVVRLGEFFRERGLDRLDLLNMDCEGSELFVLQGAEDLLAANSVRVFVEVHHDLLKTLGQSVRDLLTFFEGLGYRASTVSLSDLKLGEDWEACEYLYARR